MSFLELYQFAQELTPKVSRKNIRAKSLELTGVPKIVHVKSPMDVAVCRGLYLSPQNTSHRIVQQVGKHVIVTARGLNVCWERFVYVKELMHIFSPTDEATDSGEKFEALLNEFSGPQSKVSPQMRSEVNSFWMALAVLCPEKNRLEFEQKRKNNEIDDYSIALELRIPQQYVPRLFEKRYQTFITELTQA